MAIKVVWAYAIVILLGGLAMLLYMRWQDAGGFLPFLGGLVAMGGAAVVGVRRGTKRRQAMEAEEAGRRRDGSAHPGSG